MQTLRALLFLPGLGWGGAWDAGTLVDKRGVDRSFGFLGSRVHVAFVCPATRGDFCKSSCKALAKRLQELFTRIASSCQTKDLTTNIKLALVRDICSLKRTKKSLKALSWGCRTALFGRGERALDMPSAKRSGFLNQSGFWLKKTLAA